MDQQLPRPEYSVTRQVPSRSPISAQNCLRVYNYAPHLVALQIRGTNSYHAITLTESNLAKLRGMIDLAMQDMMPAYNESGAS